MAEVATNLRNQPEPNTILIQGRITRMRQYNGVNYYEVTLPAPDSFSSPQRVGVESSNPIGQLEQDVSVKCTPKGYTNVFTRKDGQQGWKVESSFVVAS